MLHTLLKRWIFLDSDLCWSPCTETGLNQRPGFPPASEGPYSVYACDRNWWSEPWKCFLFFSIKEYRKNYCFFTVPFPSIKKAKRRNSTTSLDLRCCFDSVSETSDLTFIKPYSLCLTFWLENILLQNVVLKSLKQNSHKVIRKLKE